MGMSEWCKRWSDRPIHAHMHTTNTRQQLPLASQVFIETKKQTRRSCLADVMSWPLFPIHQVEYTNKPEEKQRKMIWRFDACNHNNIPNQSKNNSRSLLARWGSFLFFCALLGFGHMGLAKWATRDVMMRRRRGRDEWRSNEKERGEKDVGEFVIVLFSVFWAHLMTFAIDETMMSGDTLWVLYLFACKHTWKSSSTIDVSNVSIKIRNVNMWMQLSKMLSNGDKQKNEEWLA